LAPDLATSCVLGAGWGEAMSEGNRGGSAEQVLSRQPAAVVLPALLPLGLIAGISPLATDMYIPALPELAQNLQTDASVAQLSLTAFLTAFAIGQLVIGPVSDAVGRRTIMVVGTAVFALASVACALAPSALLLIIARTVQGLAGAAASIVARAMVTDVLTGVRRARTIGMLSAINSVGPVVAPLIGGALLLVGSWRLTFWTLAVIGGILCVCVIATFGETLPVDRRAPGISLSANAGRMLTLLKIPRLSLYIATSCIGTVGFFAYIATSSFVFQTYYGFTDTQYTAVFATNAFCMILATLIFSRFVGRVSEDRFLSVGLLVGTAASSGVLLCAVLGTPAVAVWICLAVVTGSWGLVITASATRTQALGSAMPGTAAALQGGLAFGLGGLGTPLAGLLGGTPMAMGAVMVAGLGLATILQIIVPKIWRMS
jgi:MFS transporter, DHA1 family, multidrug resistance protein